MPSVIGVAFKPVTKVYYFDPAGHEDLRTGERVVVDTARGRALGIVVQPAREVAVAEISGALKPVVRRATAIDMVQQDQQEHREPEVLQLCRNRAAALNLPMKVDQVEFNFDGTSLVVYFTAETRVDFRNLVHDLSQSLHAHVEMRQIGVRDQAKFIGGYGRCGRQLCCAGWLREFTPVSIKMAKQQDLPLNPAEISGSCGRLLCCLSYENDDYGEARRFLPRLNSTWNTPEGPGKVRQVHVLRNSVTVQVQGPNDTKLMIEVAITEEERAAAGGGCAGCPAASAEPAERELLDASPDGADELDDPGRGRAAPGRLTAGGEDVYSAGSEDQAPPAGSSGSREGQRPAPRGRPRGPKPPAGAPRKQR